jgi:hypothetical protein
LPYPHVAPQYGAKIQYTLDANYSPPLSRDETKYIQAVAGTLLYYGWARHPPPCNRPLKLCLFLEPMAESP